MKAVVAAFNQEKALVGAFSVITNLRMNLLEALADTAQITSSRHNSRYTAISIYLLRLQAPAPPPAVAATAVSCATPAAAAASSLTDINIFLLGNIFLLSQHKYFRSGTRDHFPPLIQTQSTGGYNTTSQSQLQTTHSRLSIV